MAVISSRVMDASFKASRITWLIFSICFLDAISGTTPPDRVWRAIWEEITLDRTSLPFFTTAAAVSSQELSMARIYTSSSVLRIFMIVSKPLSGFTLRQSPVPWTSRPGLF